MLGVWLLVLTIHTGASARHQVPLRRLEVTKASILHIRIVPTTKCFTRTSINSRPVTLQSTHKSGQSSSRSIREPNTNGQNGKNGVVSATKSNEILSFLGRVFEAQTIAQKALPSARLLRVQATLPAGPFYPVTDPLRLSQLYVLFAADSGECVTVRSTGWDERAPPVVKKGTPILGLQTFAVEDCKVEITQADQAVRDQAGTKSFFEVTLSKPLGNPQDGPYDPLYTFQMIDTSLISVNAVTGKIVGNSFSEVAWSGCESCDEAIV